MLPLRDLQKLFAEALFDGVPDAVAPWIHGYEKGAAQSVELDARSRIAIYRNNLHEGFRKALALEFPVIERLVGEDYFRQLALAFQVEHPSRFGDLHGIGEPFARFLLRQFEDTQYAYLPDVAALEWAYQQSSVAADALSFDPDALRQIPQEGYAQLRFSLHPACGLVRSPYPVMRIWAANQPSADTDELVDLSSGADFILLRRAADGVEMRRIGAAEFAMLDALSHGAKLIDALESAYAVDPDFDLAEALRRLIALDVLTGIQPTSSPPPGEPLS